MTDYFVGVDLGQVHNFTAVAVVGLDDDYLGALKAQNKAYGRLRSIRESPLFDEVDLRVAKRETEERLDPLPEPIYEVRHLQRLPQGTSYPEVVEEVQSLLDTPPLRDNSELAVDATGVGAAVVDMLKRAGLYFKSVTLTVGENEVREGDVCRVPKRDLISTAQVLLQTRRLKIAPALPEARNLTEELSNFRYTITHSATDTYGAWRDGVHDDLVLAVSLAVWAAERHSPPVNGTLTRTTGLASESLKELSFPPSERRPF